MLSEPERSEYQVSSDSLQSFSKAQPSHSHLAPQNSEYAANTLAPNMSLGSRLPSSAQNNTPAHHLPQLQFQSDGWWVGALKRGNESLGMRQLKPWKTGERISFYHAVVLKYLTNVFTSWPIG